MQYVRMSGPHMLLCIMVIVCAASLGVSYGQSIDGSFITTWVTTTPGESITIPVGGATGTYTVNWGDGSTTTQQGDASHKYEDAGTYTVVISGDFTRIMLGNDKHNAAKLHSIERWGTIQWDMMNSAFSGASNMAYNATDTPDLSGVTDMSNMFQGASSFNGDISRWDVSGVTDMGGMFHNAYSFNQPLNSWDVSSVTGMRYMFAGTSFNQPLNSWDVSSVTQMGSMFEDAHSFNQPLNSWDVSSVIHTKQMFHNAHSFNQPLNSWDVSSAEILVSMFHNAHSFNQPLNSWDVSSAIYMNDMFQGATSFDQNLGNWHIALDDAHVERGNSVVTTIHAQNDHLAGDILTYIVAPGGDGDLFQVRGDTLWFIPDKHTKTTYDITIMSTGGLASPNSRDVTITVTDSDSLPHPTIGGVVFSDDNGNGVQDAGERGIPDYTMYAVDLADPDTVLETVTGMHGTYTFEMPRTSKALVQTSYFPFHHILTTGSFYKYVQLKAGSAVPFDVGFSKDLQHVTLDVSVYGDENGNGIQDAGETHIPNTDILIHEYTTNRQEIITTNTDGTASKRDIVPGSFLAQVVLPQGYAAATSPTDPESGVLGALTVIEPVPDSTVHMNIGLVPLEHVSLEILAYEDINTNGIRDEGEVAIPNITVYVYHLDADNETEYEITTGPDGTAEIVILAADFAAELDFPHQYSVATSPVDHANMAGTFTVKEPVPGHTYSMKVGLVPFIGDDVIDKASRTALDHHCDNIWVVSPQGDLGCVDVLTAIGLESYGWEPLDEYGYIDPSYFSDARSYIPTYHDRHAEGALDISLQISELPLVGQTATVTLDVKSPEAYRPVDVLFEFLFIGDVEIISSDPPIHISEYATSQYAGQWFHTDVMSILPGGALKFSVTFVPVDETPLFIYADGYDEKSSGAATSSDARMYLFLGNKESGYQLKSDSYTRDPDTQYMWTQRPHSQCWTSPWHNSGQTVQDYYHHLGIQILDTKNSYHPHGFCAACSCGGGSILFLTPESDYDMIPLRYLY